MANSIIDIKRLKVIYNQGKINQSVSLNDISLKIFPGEFVMIYGPSGCGKSTLLNTIAGLQAPSEGEVFFDGKNLTQIKNGEILEIHRFGVGMIFQAFYLLPSINVLDNVCLPKIFCGESKKERKEAGMGLLRRFSISEQANKFPSQLSGGQKQRVAIARALINNPKIILADEPVGNLDSESSENVMKILKELNDIDKKTIILVTHNAEHAYYADRVIHMRDGKIVSEEINRDKRPRSIVKEEILKEPEVISNELRILMRTFKNFSPSQIGGLLIPYKAKQLIVYLTSQLTEEQLRVAENFLKDFLFENIDKNKFRMNLDLDLDEGGAGWNKQRSDKFAERVEKMLNQVKNISVNGGNSIPSLADYLIDVFNIKTEDQMRSRMIDFLKLRAGNKIDCFGLKERLDAALSLGGAGLYKNTVDKVVREVEMLMLLKYTGKN